MAIIINVDLSFYCVQIIYTESSVYCIYACEHGAARMLILCKIPSGPLDIQTLLFMFFNSNYRDKKEQDHVLMIIPFCIYSQQRRPQSAHQDQHKANCSEGLTKMNQKTHELTAYRQDEVCSIERVQAPGSLVYQQCRCACSKPSPKGLQCSGSAASSANNTAFHHTEDWWSI